MKQMKLNAAPILMLCAAGLWCTVAAAQQAVLGGQPVTAVPSAGSAPAAGYQPIAPSFLGQNDDPKPKKSLSQAVGDEPSDAYYDEMKGARHKH